MITIYIDESGTLPDPKDKVIVVAAVATQTPEEMYQLFSSQIKKEPLRKKSTELKFYTAGDKTKQKFFKELMQSNVDIYILVVDKLGRKIADTPENFAVLNSVLLAEVLPFYEGKKEIVFDKHFHRKDALQQFDNCLERLLADKNIRLKHVESQENKLVNLADMVAGATLAYSSGKNTHFYDMFERQVIVEIRIKWPEVKRRLFSKKNLV